METSRISSRAKCLREKGNFALRKFMYDFDKPQFSSEDLRNDVGNLAPKLKALIENIQRLDNEDMKREGNVFKHFIFTDIKTLQGAKSIASVFIAHGMNLVITSRKDISQLETSHETEEDHKKNIRGGGGDGNLNHITNNSSSKLTGSAIEDHNIEYGIIGDGNTQLGGGVADLSLKTTPIIEPANRNNFAVLTSSPLYKSEISVSLRKEIIATFNSRPENIHGELIRFIIADSGYKEGIDLFDVKYVHIMEPQISQADLTQAIGRGTRKCGQAGLHFVPGRGWRLNVYVYNLELPKTADLYNYPDLHSLVMASSELNLGLINFHRELTTVAIQSAVDYDLNYKVNFFRIDNPSAPITDDTTAANITGGAIAKRQNTRQTLKKQISRDRKTRKQLHNIIHETGRASIPIQILENTHTSSPIPLTKQKHNIIATSPKINEKQLANLTSPKVAQKVPETSPKVAEKTSETSTKISPKIAPKASEPSTKTSPKIAPKVPEIPPKIAENVRVKAKGVIQQKNSFLPEKPYVERKNQIDVESIDFTGYCGFRPTKNVPFVIREMRNIFEALGKTPKHGLTNARDYYCALGEKYDKYALAMREYAKFVNEYVLSQNPNAKKELELIEDEDANVEKARKTGIDKLSVMEEDDTTMNEEMKYALNSIDKLKNIKKLDELQRFIIDTYNRYAWDSPIIENGCTDIVQQYREKALSQKNIGSSFVENLGENDAKSASSPPPQPQKSSHKLVTFTKSQDFIRHFLIPESPYRGILLWHSVGTGKTCAAVAAATTRFEKMGYSILWVTRNTLVADIWKNIFGAVCSIPLQEKIAHEGDTFMMPNSQADRRRLLSRAWFKPITYKAFTNALKGRNELGQMLLRRNGPDDILRKTIVIIDEVHKIYGGDLKPQEAPDVPAIEQAIWNSYTTSGDDSVRLLLMSATPMTHNPLELIKILNLLQPTPEMRLPTIYREFAAKFLDATTGEFTPSGREEFQTQIFGLISYLNRENDPREFATVVLRNVFVRINNNSFKTFEQFRDEIMEDIVTKMDNINAKLAQCDMNDLESEYHKQRHTIESQYYGEEKRIALRDFESSYKDFIRNCRSLNSEYSKLIAKYDKTFAQVEKKYAAFLKKTGAQGNIINIFVDCLTKSSSTRHQPIKTYEGDEIGNEMIRPNISDGENYAIETHIDDDLRIDELLINTIAEAVDTQVDKSSSQNATQIIESVAEEIQGDVITAPTLNTHTDNWNESSPEIKTEIKTEVANNIIDKLLEPGKNAVKKIISLPLQTRLGRFIVTKITNVIDYLNEIADEAERKEKEEQYLIENENREEFRRQMKMIFDKLSEEDRQNIDNWLKNPKNMDQMLTQTVKQAAGIDQTPSEIVRFPATTAQPQPPIQQQQPHSQYHQENIGMRVMEQARGVQPMMRQPLVPRMMQQQPYRKPSPVKNTTDAARYNNPRVAEQFQRQKHAETQRDRFRGRPPPPRR